MTLTFYCVTLKLFQLVYLIKLNNFLMHMSILNILSFWDILTFLWFLAHKMRTLFSAPGELFSGDTQIKFEMCMHTFSLWPFRKCKQIHSSFSSYGGKCGTKWVMKKSKRGDNSEKKRNFEKIRKTFLQILMLHKCWKFEQNRSSRFCSRGDTKSTRRKKKEEK